jgi:hypothetical protein
LGESFLRSLPLILLVRGTAEARSDKKKRRVFGVQAFSAGVNLDFAGAPTHGDRRGRWLEINPDDGTVQFVPQAAHLHEVLL